MMEFAVQSRGRGFVAFGGQRWESRSIIFIGFFRTIKTVEKSFCGHNFSRIVSRSQERIGPISIAWHAGSDGRSVPIHNAPFHGYFFQKVGSVVKRKVLAGVGDGKGSAVNAKLNDKIIRNCLLVVRMPNTKACYVAIIISGTPDLICVTWDNIKDFVALNRCFHWVSVFDIAWISEKSFATGNRNGSIQFAASNVVVPNSLSFPLFGLVQCERHGKRAYD